MPMSSLPEWEMVCENTSRLRIEGGWIYTIGNGDNPSTVYVPMCDEAREELFELVGLRDLATEEAPLQERKLDPLLNYLDEEIAKRLAAFLPKTPSSQD